MQKTYNLILKKKNHSLLWRGIHQVIQKFMFGTIIPVMYITPITHLWGDGQYSAS